MVQCYHIVISLITMKPSGRSLVLPATASILKMLRYLARYMQTSAIR